MAKIEIAVVRPESDSFYARRTVDGVHERLQSLGEEIANSVSHGIGVVAALVGIPFLIIHAVQLGHLGYIVGVCVFSVTILLLYLSSTLYHAFPRGKAKAVFHVIEHAAIYLLIAGTYTPLTLGVLHGTWGWILFGMVWTFAVAGVILKVAGRARHPALSTALYLCMGWTIVIALRPLALRMPLQGIIWLIAGGFAYTLGVIFFSATRLRYHHLIWHLFVMAGTTAHYVMVYWYGA